MPERFEIPLDPAGTADKHMVRPGKTVGGHDFARELPQPPLHPVAGHGVADLAADREADPNPGVAVTAIADEEDETGSRRAPTGVRSEEVRAFPKND